ncbi:hypothetical protein MLD38_003107 [Melastoma candidum]|uniref:Uncharacterized protein n=1 Tax=Melastoma candidum TaxID=119954 RepID=A0ACB9S0R3_9MYRT|nr:hypothetical protein MLD38_003107 [Melastoma candidum]
MDDGGQGDFSVATFPRKEYYELSNKIMVAAIVSLSIVIFLICSLHLYARHVIRRRELSRAAARALALRVALSRSERLGSRMVGVDPSSIPLFVYRAMGSDKDELALECPVCLSLFEDGDAARVLPNCKHSFHAECIDKWLGSNATCPVCRAGATPRLRMESREPPVRLGPFEMVTIRTVKPSHTASSSCLEGTSEEGRKAVTGGGSSARFGPINRILSWEKPLPRTQGNSHEEDGTEHNLESR